MDQLPSDFAVGVASSLFAAVAIALVVHLWRNRISLYAYGGIIRLPAESRERLLSGPAKIAGLRRGLLRRLLSDQARSGPHVGQFGHHSRSDEEEEAFQTGPEFLPLKPRIYLTLWPVDVMTRRGLAPRRCAKAAWGIKRLFWKGRIRVYQSAAQAPSPLEQTILISHRHTMGGALILHQVDPFNPIQRDVLGAMIDETAGWQNADNGWGQCDREYTGSDLWASIYAARLLDLASQATTFSDSERAAFAAALRRTLDYFAVLWRTSQWSYGGSKAEENAVLVLIELAPILRRLDHPLLASVSTHFKAWLTPLGQPGERYLEVMRGRTLIQQCGRLAYALFRAGEPAQLWRVSFEKALRHLGERASSADIAFLLDLSYEIEAARV